jgi:outer membrane lipoprotein SlyB
VLFKPLVMTTAMAMLASSCMTYTTTSRVWAEPGSGSGWERDGHVQWIRETDRVAQGHPGAGAAAGAVIGGLLGSAITGRGIGALLGAAGGAVVGAESSRGSSEYRTYDVLVAFNDGGSELFTFPGYPPFHPGEPVKLTPAGLVAEAASPPATAGHASVTPPSPQPSQPPPPSPYEPSRPPATAQGTAAAPSGEWAYTQQYGWVWMPYGDGYVYAPADGDSDPHMYVYLSGVGWTWVVAPWLWGWGPRPYFVAHVGPRFGWYGHGWGTGWHGYRPAPYRYGFVYHGRFADNRGLHPHRHDEAHHH